MRERDLRGIFVRGNGQPGDARQPKMIIMKHVYKILLLPLLLVGCVSEKNGGVAMQSPSGPVFNITAYGAVDNPKIPSTDAFRRAIADCQKAGGGIVRVPAGHFLTGPLDMVDNMTLQVDSGTVVLFDTERTNYPDISSRWEGLTENGPHPLIFANGLHNIAITGHGTFDGQGAAWWANMDMAEHGNARPNRPIRRRPMFVTIKDCNGVRIDGLTFINAPFWNIHLLYSENIDVGNCRIIAPSNSPNTDALNTDSCRHVVVHDCFADVGDDGFGIKSGRDEEGRKMNRPTEDVTYIRSEESGGVRHVRFIDCTGDGTDNGIRLKSMRGRGGIVEDIVASNFHLKNVRNAIILSLRYVKTPEEPFSERTPVFRDIHINHVIARDSGNCCVIEGLEESPIQNVTLNNLDLSGTNGVTCAYAKDISFNNVRIAAQHNLYVENHAQNIQRSNWKEVTFAPATR
jgi:polygalacturonase